MPTASRWIACVCLIISMNAHATFIPADQIRASYNPWPKDANLSEAEFQRIISEIQKRYEAQVKAHGGKLQMYGDWKSETLNAGATQQMGNWKVQITGALARRPELTPDGFALILCHELGHHLAGFPFSKAGFGGTWAASEGQSDYFATHVCAREMWGRDYAENAKARTLVSTYVQQRCDDIWRSSVDQDLCYRQSLAVQSMITTMATLMKKPIPQFETPDPTQVAKTNDAHPPVQCRLDTSLQGALCLAGWRSDLIPGKKANGGPHGRNAEIEAAEVSCMASNGQSVGLRPACWFKETLAF